MENRLKLEDIENLVKAVLTPYRNGLTLRQFITEFKKVAHFDLPLDMFGYSSVLLLLKDFNGVGIRAQDNHFNELDYIVFALRDDRIQHIQQMVDDQRQHNQKIVLKPNTSNRMTRRRVENRNHSFEPYLLEVKQTDETELNRRMDELDIESNPRRARPRKAVCPLPYNRVIPMSERIKMKQLMDKFYKGINLSNIGSLYKQFHGNYPPLEELGFSCWEELLKDLTDLVKLVETPDGYQVLPVTANRNKEVPNHPLIKELCIEKENTSDRSTIESNPLIPRKDLEDFLKILRTYPNGMPANQFAVQYQKRFNTPLIVHKWGFGSPIEMFCSLENVFDLVKPESGVLDMDEWTLRESTPLIRAEKSRNNNYIKKKRFDKQFKTRVEFIVKAIHDTVPKPYFLVEDFSMAYYIKYGEQIDLQQFGYKTLKDLFNELSKEINISVKERYKNEPYLVYINKGLVIK